MGTAGARTRISVISLCLCVHAWGAGRAPARVRACGDTQESRRTHHGEEKLRGQRDGGGEKAKEGRKRPRGDEEVREAQIREHQPKFDSTSSRGESSPP